MRMRVKTNARDRELAGAMFQDCRNGLYRPEVPKAERLCRAKRCSREGGQGTGLQVSDNVDESTRVLIDYREAVESRKKKKDMMSETETRLHEFERRYMELWTRYQALEAE